MFIPFDRKLDWRNPPYITIVLIIVNIVIFTFFQTQDSEKFNVAYDYYINSELPEIEIPQYIKYLNSNNNLAQENKKNLYNKKTDHKNRENIIFELLANGDFNKSLEQNQIIKLDSELYIKWKLQRDQFNNMRNKITGYHYALFAYAPGYLNFITYQFLHADWSHLMGNMLFLFIFGFVLESALNRSVYIASYLLSGIGSGLFYIFLDPNSAVASIGASGSISGLVGIYTVIFGFRKIKFFYYILFYFNYIKAPAIILLPLWLIYEISLPLWSPSNVNNLAHIGGLVSGVILAVIIKRFTNLINITYVDKTDEIQKYLSDYNLALDFISKLEFKQAKTILLELNKLNPDDANVHFQLYNIEKHTPTSELFHKQARKLLSNTDSDTDTVKMLHSIYTEYNAIATPPKLSANLLFKLAIKFSVSPYTSDAEKIILLLLNKRPDFEKIPLGLVRLIANYKIQNNQLKETKYFSILKNKYPDSNEAKKIIIN